MTRHSVEPRLVILVATVLLAASFAGCVKNMPELKEALGAGEKVTPPMDPLARAIATPSIAKVNEPVSFSGLTSKDPEDGGLTYAWSFGADGAAEGGVVVKRFTTPGTRNVTLVVTTARGATDTTTITVDIEARNSAPAARLVIDPVIQRAGRPVTFDASGSMDPDGGALTYEWDFGDGTTVPQRSTPKAEHTYARPGLYAATVTVRDPEGLISSASRLVGINWNNTWAGERLSVLENTREYTLPVPALATRILINATFASGLGINALNFTLEDGEGNAVALANATTQLGDQAAGNASLVLTRDILLRYAPGDWTLTVERAKGIDVEYSLHAAVRVD